MRIPLPNRIAGLHRLAVELWHEGSAVKGKDVFERLVLDQHWYNYELWHQEDEARRTDVPDSVIAQVKRNIDALNQARNDAIERLDEAMADDCRRKKGRMNSETAGSVVDRLSILALRIYHMAEQARRKNIPKEHRSACLSKLKVLKRQKDDLVTCLGELVRDMQAGRKIVRIYRQFKMYNDPALNPALYSKKR